MNNVSSSNNQNRPAVLYTQTLLISYFHFHTTHNELKKEKNSVELISRYNYTNEIYELSHRKFVAWRFSLENTRDFKRFIVFIVKKWIKKRST